MRMQTSLMFQAVPISIMGLQTIQINIFTENIEIISYSLLTFIEKIITTIITAII